MKQAKLSDLEDMVGSEVGISSWTLIDQERVNRFAEVTEDLQFIHVDPERAKNTVFGGTIVHGFFLLSMIPKFSYEASIEIEGAAVLINYGLNKVRFIGAVPTGSRIRARFNLKSFERRSDTRIILTYDVTIEIDGVEKPAAIVEWMMMQELAT